MGQLDWQIGSFVVAVATIQNGTHTQNTDNTTYARTIVVYKAIAATERDKPKADAAVTFAYAVVYYGQHCIAFIIIVPIVL